MIKPGLVSVTFRRLSPHRVIELAAAAGLQGIEWGGDVHVPPGNFELAGRVGSLTRAAGLMPYAYGSYFRLGLEAEQGKAFETTLHTAEALGTQLIRVWAGPVGSGDATPALRRRIAQESRLLGDLAARAGLRIAYEFHEGTLCDTADSCQALLEAVDHPAIGTYWQPIHGMDAETNALGLAQLRPWLAGVHVFHWWPKAEIRHPLAQGHGNWMRYFDMLADFPRDIFASLEFVLDDDEAILKTDAAELQHLLAAIPQ